MTIELTPVSHGVAKTSQPVANGKGKAASATAADALGFFAMLSAADDALTLSADASGLASGSGGTLASAEPEEADVLALEADVSALAGWVLGVPAPVAKDVPPLGEGGAPTPGAPLAGARRPAWSAVEPETQPSNALLAATHKAGKTTSTADLQKSQDGPSVALPQGHEDVSRKLFDAEMVRVREAVSTLGLESKAVSAPVAAQASVGERRVLEPVVAKASPTDATYFQTQGASAPMGMDGVVATQASMPLEAYVAEQVTYWIGQEVQSAELTLDGMGFSPVEVSISMQGNEAQVAFRTDELHARDAIENASAQLKDLLQSQGVVLTGMSVGTSHSGDASGQGGRPRQEGRQATVMAPAPVEAESSARARIPQGRALDLFV
jgi:flagellar hook-length control protein FliK